MNRLSGLCFAIFGLAGWLLIGYRIGYTRSLQLSFFFFMLLRGLDLLLLKRTTDSKKQKNEEEKKGDEHE